MQVEQIVVPNNHREIIGMELFQALCVTLQQEISSKYKNLTNRIVRSVNHTVKSKFKPQFTTIHQKGRRIPLHLETQVEVELRKLQQNGHITKLNECSDKFFISPIGITVKRDNSIKLTMDAKTINKAIHKTRTKMHNIDCLMNSIAQTITQSSNEGEVLFSTIDLRYSYSQLPLDGDTAKHCNFYRKIQIQHRILRFYRYAKRNSKSN